ncbi:uncharacterized protein LOC124457278 [Xenia sp. Carnegie-2017]|uniref:uncharacterized protein LOC124457278 n=1 Tax=Xenia sp. Carnegie-2017 TaxID=2897299 RepID=UPI001F037020|nr:uncharacterized protein LOC124457278 [Xenia sp. Carnegie-2017]
MQSREKINNSYLQEILTDVVEKKIVDLFIQEWNTHYKKSHGEWENTNVSGMKLFNIEKTKKKPLDKHIMSKFQDGDTILPCKSNHDVVKRTELLNQLTADLNNLRSTNNNELTYYYISGNPGSGKSELARQVCEEMYNSFDWEKNTTFVMTLEGKDIDSLLKTYVELCKRLSNDKTVIENISKEAKSSEEKIKDFQLFLTQQLKLWQTWWIVVDNNNGRVRKRKRVL